MPRLVGPGAVDRGEGVVLGPMPRGVDRAQHDIADADLSSVRERLMWKRRSCDGVNADRQPVLEREPPVPRDVVGVRVRLEHRDEFDAPPLALVEILLDCIRGIDEHRGSGVLVADQVGRTAEVVVDELLEEHVRDRSNRRGYIFESGAPSAALSSSSSSSRQTYQPIASRKTIVCSPFITIPPRFRGSARGPRAWARARRTNRKDGSRR